MRKFATVATLTIVCVLAVPTSAAAHEGGGKYGFRRPIVAAASGVVKQPKGVSVTANRFCPHKPISISISKRGNTATKWTTTNWKGQASATFQSSTLKPGTYAIVASQPGCKLWAGSWVTVTNQRGRLMTDDGSDASAAFDEIAVGMRAREGAIERASARTPLPTDMTSGGSSGIDAARLGLVAGIGAGGLAVVSFCRGRQNRRPTLG